MTNILENIIADKKNFLERIKKEKSLNTLEKNIQGQNRVFKFKDRSFNQIDFGQSCG